MLRLLITCFCCCAAFPLPVSHRSAGSAVGPAVSGKPLFTFGRYRRALFECQKRGRPTVALPRIGEKLREAVAAFNRAHVDFIVSLGDMIIVQRYQAYAVIGDSGGFRGSCLQRILRITITWGRTHGSGEQRRVLENSAFQTPNCSVVNGYRLLFSTATIFQSTPVQRVAGYEGRPLLLDSLKGPARRTPGNTTVRSEKRSGVDDPGTVRRESRGERDLLRPPALCRRTGGLHCGIIRRLPPCCEMPLCPGVPLQAIITRGQPPFRLVQHFTFQGMIEGTGQPLCDRPGFIPTSS